MCCLDTEVNIWTNWAPTVWHKIPAPTTWIAATVKDMMTTHYYFFNYFIKRYISLNVPEWKEIKWGCKGLECAWGNNGSAAGWTAGGGIIKANIQFYRTPGYKLLQWLFPHPVFSVTLPTSFCHIFFFSSHQKRKINQLLGFVCFIHFW